MKFTYILNGIGWADVLLKINEKELFLSPNDISEPLIKLVDGVLSLIYADKKVVIFEWDEEPRIDKWTSTKREGNSINIKIELFPDSFSKLGVVAFDEECLLIDFSKEILRAMEEILRTHGLVGYKETWCNSDFPISSYLRLKEYLKECDLIERKYKYADNCIEMICTDLTKELDIIRDIVNNS